MTSGGSLEAWMATAALGTMGALPPLSERGVGRDSVEPFQRLKFSVSGLKQGQGLNLES